MSEKLPSDDGNGTDLGTGLSSMPTSQSPQGKIRPLPLATDMPLCSLVFSESGDINLSTR